MRTIFKISISAFVFATASISIFAQAITITNVGVGVGTSTPTNKFTIDNGSNFGPSSSVYSGLQLKGSYGGGVTFQDGSGYAGIWTSGLGGVLNFKTNGSLASGFGSDTGSMIVNGSGNVGIGTGNATARLTVTNGDDAKLKIYSSGGSVGIIDTVANTSESTGRWLSINPTGGNVGIGTQTPQYKLQVAGSVQATSFVTPAHTYADYVFSKDYQLPSLSQVEQHIKTEGHLPGIPSEKEAVAHGINVGDMQIKLLAQVEQLTLHAIEQEKLIKAQGELIEGLLRAAAQSKGNSP